MGRYLAWEKKRWQAGLAAWRRGPVREYRIIAQDGTCYNCSSYLAHLTVSPLLLCQKLYVYPWLGLQAGTEFRTPGSQQLGG